MEEVSLPVIVCCTPDVPQLIEIEREFPFSEPSLHELDGAHFKLTMEDVKSEVTSEASLRAVVDTTTAGPHLNKIGKEFSYSEADSDGKQDGTSVQLLDFQIKSEPPDVIYIKREPLEGDELHIENEIDSNPTDPRKEKSPGDQHFDCNLCNSKFTCKLKFQQHLKNHTEAQAFQCSMSDYQYFTQNSGPSNSSTCDYLSVWKGRLKELLTSHTGEKPFKCTICNYRCIQSDELQQHIRMHAGEKPFKCSVCNYRFVQKVHLQRHMMTHTGEKPFECSVCDYRCVQKSGLQQHMITHTGEKPFQCSVCNYGCVQRSSLQRHMMSHTGEKPFKCSVCNYRCVQKSGLQQHMRTHTGEKPFHCGVCNYRCAQKNDLRRHIMTHTGEKPFKCSICNYRCRDKTGVQRHRCAGQKPFKCSVCNYRCVQKRGLQRHMMTHIREKPL